MKPCFATPCRPKSALSWNQQIDLHNLLVLKHCSSHSAANGSERVSQECEASCCTGISVNMSAFAATFLAEAAFDPRILLPYSHMGQAQELVCPQT